MVVLCKFLNETVISCLNLRGCAYAENSHFENKTINASILQKGSAGEMHKQFLYHILLS